MIYFVCQYYYWAHIFLFLQFPLLHFSLRDTTNLSQTGCFVWFYLNINPIIFVYVFSSRICSKIQTYVMHILYHRQIQKHLVRRKLIGLNIFNTLRPRKLKHDKILTETIYDWTVQFLDFYNIHFCNLNFNHQVLTKQLYLFIYEQGSCVCLKDFRF